LRTARGKIQGGEFSQELFFIFSVARRIVLRFKIRSKKQHLFLGAIMTDNMTTKRKYLKHGDIVEIALPRTKKFAYGKIIDPRKIKDPFDHPSFIRVFNSIQKDRIQDVKDLDRRLLLAPFWLVGQSAAVTKFGWKIIATEIVDAQEEFIPDTKTEWPKLSEKPEKWGYIKRFDTNVIFADFHKVKHLDKSSGKNIEIVPFLIELEILKIKGKDIKKEYGLKDWLEKEYYTIFSALPVYSNLPDKLKGRVSF
jgi:hypothetical protein